eukprot:572365-Amphidinium_carterae.1
MDDSGSTEVENTATERAARERHLELVQYDANHLRDVPERYKADHDIVLAAVKKRGHALQYAAAECKADHDIVLEA